MLISTGIFFEVGMDFISGFELTLDDKSGWENLLPAPGQVLEVHMNSTSLDVQHDSWGGFFIDKVELHPEGSVTLQARLIEAEDQTISEALARFSASGRFAIHLCRSRPCAEVGEEQEGKLHVTRVKLFVFNEYIEDADYVSTTQKRLAKGWNRYLLKKKEEEALKKQPSRAKEPPLPKATEKSDGRRKTRTHPPTATARDGAPGKTAKVPGISDEMKSKLEERLKAVKGRVAPRTATGIREVAPEPEEALSSGQDTEDSDSVQEAPKLTGGTKLLPLPPVILEETPTGLVDHGLKVADEVKKKKNKLKHSGKEDTKGTTSRSLRGQLVQRAVLAAQNKKSVKKHGRKKSKGDAVKKLSDALSMILTSSSSKKEKKAKKRKKRLTTAEGVIVSCSASSSSTSDIDEDDDEVSSDQDLETPMRKRSRDHPGSVLQLLTDHVRDQLQQSATTEVETTDSSITSGVKVMTYFMLQLRPHFQGYQREMRELHHLSACIDALRRGDVATTGDALAGRFIALHQSMIDQNWHTARHMEIFPIEESSAANTAMVLATRKHSKLVAKAQGLSYPTTWTPRGKGRGKGDWTYWNETKGDGKGEKGKGKKGKGKGRGKQHWGDASQGGEWKERKERPEEKQS